MNNKQIATELLKGCKRPFTKSTTTGQIYHFICSDECQDNLCMWCKCYAKGLLTAWKNELESTDKLSKVNYCIACQRKNKSIRERIQQLNEAIKLLKEEGVEDGD